MAATAHHHQGEEPFEIHEDARTEDTEMMAEEERTEEAVPPTDEAEQQQYHHQAPQHQHQQSFEEEEEEDIPDESSEDEAVDRTVQADMEKLQGDFPGFRNKYRLIKRIGEGNWSLRLA